MMLSQRLQETLGRGFEIELYRKTFYRVEL
jgi:hypothetical protein